MNARDRGDLRASRLFADQASQSAAALREQAVSRAAEKRAELNRYLLDLESVSGATHVVTAVIAVLDGLLLAGCTLILLAYQRRTERQAGNSAFRATHDQLTGLPNRAHLLDRLDAELAAGVAPHTGRVVLLLLDLDGFKYVNDGLGHHLGDTLLARIGRRVQLAAADATTTVARIGGDEFAVLLAHSSLTAALLLAERIRDEVRRPVDLDGLTAQVGCSIGVAVHPDHGATTTELLKSADIAMYDAKRRRVGVAVFSTEGNEHTSDRLVVLSELRRALEADGEIVMHYQPKVHAENGEVCGVEALVRWQHPTRGLLRPADFIVAAERSDLIIPLTDRVLEISCAQLARWLAVGLVLPVSINVSVAALIDRGLPLRVADLLADHGLPPELVTLEITETALIADQDRTRESLNRTARAGGPSLARRLRHRLLVAVAPDHAAAGAQDRPPVRHGHDDLRAEPRHRPRGGGRRPRPRAAGGGGGRRGPRHPRGAAQARMRRGPGLPAVPAGARGRAAGVAAPPGRRRAQRRALTPAGRTAALPGRRTQPFPG